MSLKKAKRGTHLLSNPMRCQLDRSLKTIRERFGDTGMPAVEAEAGFPVLEYFGALTKLVH
jgi:hypothetical protein